ncbi:MAG: hypothetical protein ACPGWR_29825, partial [Ardenticatenaceae bacterium]
LADSPKPQAPADSPKPQALADSPKPQAPADSPKPQALADSPKPQAPADSPKPQAPADSPKPEVLAQNKFESKATTSRSAGEYSVRVVSEGHAGWARQRQQRVRKVIGEETWPSFQV